MNILRLLLVFGFLSPAVLSHAQILAAKVGVNGLTCSMCTRSVEMSLRRLDFVDSVGMSLENTEGVIYFKKDLPVNLDQIAKAVVNAGFSVRYVSILFDFNNLQVQENGSFVFQGQKFVCVDYHERPGKQPIWLKLIGEPFVPKSEMKSWRSKIEDGPANDKDENYYVSIEG
jgi:copper chaperone CopZ